MAGVANIGSDINWCGHPFAQANWYTYGELAWDYTLSNNNWRVNGYGKPLATIKTGKKMFSR